MACFAVEDSLLLEDRVEAETLLPFFLKRGEEVCQNRSLRVARLEDPFLST